MKFTQLASITLLATLSSLAGASTNCDFLPAREKPEWILYAPASDHNYYGIGASEVANPEKPLEALKQAKVSALNELSTNIEVQLKSRFRQEQQLSTDGDEEQFERRISSVTNIVANSTLQDVKYDEVWLDHNSCIIWVKASVSKQGINALRNQELQQGKLENVDSLIKRSRDDSRSTDSRLDDLATARLLLDQINFSVINDNNGRDFYIELLDTVSRSLGTDIETANNIKQRVVSADRALISSNNTNSYQEKNLYIREAIDGLSSILIDQPFDDTPHAWAEKAAFRIGAIYKQSNDPCKAITYFEKISYNSSSEEWSNKAYDELSTLKCTKEDRLRSTWLQSFAGRNITLVCAYRTNNTIQKWDYLCDKIQGKVQEHGASTIANTMTLAELKKNFTILSPETADSIINSNDTYLAIADGTISTRANKKNPFGKDYQFKGKVSVYMIRNGKVEYSDRFQGAGGWNPISEEMAMEVLGVHVAKRWNKKYSEILSKQ
jgi:hypothetical protein